MASYNKIKGDFRYQLLKDSDKFASCLYIIDIGNGRQHVHLDSFMYYLLKVVVRDPFHQKVTLKLKFYIFISAKPW